MGSVDIQKKKRFTNRNRPMLFISDEGPMLETLDFTFCIRSYTNLFRNIKIKLVTHNPLIDNISKVLLKPFVKLSIRCWECVTKCCVHCLTDQGWKTFEESLSIPLVPCGEN